MKGASCIKELEDGTGYRAYYCRSKADIPRQEILETVGQWVRTGYQHTLIKRGFWSYYWKVEERFKKAELFDPDLLDLHKP